MGGELLDAPPSAWPAGGRQAERGLRRRAAALARAAIRFSPLARGVVWSLPASSGAVALTFDDGPDPHWTPRVLDILEQHRATASFFLIGGKASKHCELVKRLAAAGHSLGNHTFSHQNLRGLSFRATGLELRRGAAAIEDLGVGEVRWFRPPYGAYSAAGLCHALRNRASTVLWNVDPRDYEAAGAAEILGRLGPLRSGDIVLLHDRSAALVEALPEILARIADAGLRACSLDQAHRKTA
jgi:peptidoglycan/xylan/chitin deacetylase (PgdA/CDA1 family)